MLIGDRYSEEKLYRGIKHYDGLPLTSGDIHEYADIVQQKNSYLMNNIIGSGTLNEPMCSISSEGISLLSPSVVLIDGDIALIQSSVGTPIVHMSEIATAGHTEGILCIVGWYQHLTHSDTLRDYGGVRNNILPNDIIDENLNIQVSTRYQLRWDIVLLDYEQYMSGDAITFSIPTRDKTGESSGESLTLDTPENRGNTCIISKPSTMDYAVSDLYVVPILRYAYNGTNITEAKALKPIRPLGTSNLIVSTNEPVGDYYGGTTWFNPNTREFKTYVDSTLRFVDSASKMGFLQYQSVYNIPTDVTTSQDISVPINITELREGDVLTVAYEGLILVEDIQYTINYSNNTITLLGFTANAGDQVIFTAVKIVEANDITNITATFTAHMNGTGSGTVKSHVKLSDSTNSTSDVNDGIAATPKAVKESRLIKDTTNNKAYVFGVENGLLYIEEVES